MIAKLIGKRMVMGVFTLLAAALITFTLVHLQPGSPGAIVAGIGATQDQIDAINQKIGWNQPLWQQFANWLGQILSGNLGNSYIDDRNLSEEVLTRVSVTALLSFGAVVLIAIIGVLIGVIAAVRGGWLDRVLNSGSAFVFAVPAYWLAVLLVFVFAVVLPWFPATGYVEFADDPVGWAQSLILPILALAIPGAAGMARSTRAAMFEAYSQEHMRTLRAMGVARWRIIYVHSLRFASVQIIAMIGLNFVLLFGGTVMIEQLFVLPGLGAGATTAIGQHDIPQIQATVMITTVVVVLTNLLTEIVTIFLDPKVRVK